MRRSEVLQEVRLMKFDDVYSRRTAGRLVVARDGMKGRDLVAGSVRHPCIIAIANPAPRRYGPGEAGGAYDGIDQDGETRDLPGCAGRPAPCGGGGAVGHAPHPSETRHAACAGQFDHRR